MNRVTKIVVFVIYVFGCFTNFVFAQNGKDKLSRSAKTEKYELPRFAVISDTHFENNRGEGAKVKVPQALKNLLSKKPLVDAIFVVGDLTDHGRPEEYDQLLSVFGDKTNVPESIEVYYTLGFNHDKSSSNGVEVYVEKIQQPLHQYIEIKGYPFITISERGAKPNVHNDEARQFLSEKLAEASRNYSGKPIFVFMHIPPLNTCYGSLSHEGWGTDVFLSVLNQYPQAIVFSGHSHFPLGDPRSIHQDRFTTINDGGTTYGEVEPNIVDIGIHPENYEYVTEGIIANVLKNGNVEIERWDTYRNEEILPKWIIDAPHDGSNFTYKNRNGLPAPKFPRRVQPTVKHIANDSITVTFKQAKDNDLVHHYIIEITDGKQIIASYRKFSQFYLNSQAPKDLTVGFSGIPAGKKLEVQVKAVDSYGNQSAPINKTFIVQYKQE
jgi:predicted phosphodiesterase